MAGSKIREIFCWVTTLNDLNIYLASTEKGAVRMGITLGKQINPKSFFRKLYPHTKIVENYDMNLQLIRAVEVILSNGIGLPNIKLDVSLTPFQWQVLKTIQQIPFGETRTYKEVAAMIGKPKAARAVGQALKKNPLPLICPCHRILAAKGLGGFSSGLAVKRCLLDLEKRSR
jgi:methylated-DNA-[protein]-cysteine S-methyltransferase